MVQPRRMTRTSRVAGIRADDAKYERETNTPTEQVISNNSNRATVNGTRNQHPHCLHCGREAVLAPIFRQMPMLHRLLRPWDLSHRRISRATRFPGYSCRQLFCRRLQDPQCSWNGRLRVFFALLTSASASCLSRSPTWDSVNARTVRRISCGSSEIGAPTY